MNDTTAAADASNESDTQFDDSLQKIEHYQRYPAMLPYIGPDYHLSSRPLLLIGESNYLPERSTIHKEARSWYAGKQSDLSSEEVNWINCRKILASDWAPPGHRIYKELNRCLGLLGYYRGRRPMSHVAFMNAFQRPADCGESLRWLAKDIDFRNSQNVVSSVIRSIRPQMTVFTSKYAWDTIGSHIEGRRMNTKINFVYHPACPWWNRKDSKHGRNKFDALLRSNPKI